MQPGGILFKNFQIITLRSDADEGLDIISGGALHVVGSQIAWLGNADEVPLGIKPTQVIQGEGRFLSPGLIDCHTHVVWGGQRVDDWQARLEGATYESIARGGGGILSTVRATRESSPKQLYASARSRLEVQLRHGVTGVEIKSGYGLSLESELKLLQVATELRDTMPLEVSRTLLAAHAIPPEYTGNRDGYVALICDEILPAARLHCEAVDVFCESIAFSLEQTKRILCAAQKAGLGLKVHAEQRSLQGGAALAATLGAWSADHLEYLDEEGVRTLGEQGTVAVLLPGAYYFLQEKQLPPVESLRRNHLPIAVASDMNPGSSPLATLPLAMNMACVLFGLTPAESWLGVTRHAARALRWENRLGKLDVGMQADLALWEIDRPAQLPYGIGHNPCVAVYRRGELIWSELVR